MEKTFPSNIFLAAAELAGHFMHAVEDGTEPKLILHQVVLGSLEDFVLSQATQPLEFYYVSAVEESHVQSQ